MRTTEWVLIDTETSGLGQPIYCVEIAGQRMKGLTPEGPPFRALINHDVAIEPQAEALHGYSRDFLRASGRSPVEVHRDFNAYAGTRPIVAYNLSFDWARVLEPEMRRLRLSPTYSPGFCALTLARRCVHEAENHKLDTLRRLFFPDYAPASHHALDDVELTTKLFVEVFWPRLEGSGIESFAAVADFSRKTPVKQCIDRIRNPKSQAVPSSAPVAQDLESELFGIIEGMRADDKIVDAEVWTLKEWLDTHAQHKTELATRARQLIEAAFADGHLSSWELDDIKVQLGGLIGRQQSEVPTSPDLEKKRRLSLTKRQLEEETGAALLALLERVVADGALSDAEIEELTNWLLENQGKDLPAIGYLIDVVNDIIADGKITDDERVDLFLGIEKVLPLTERRTAKAARERAEAKALREQPPKIGREELKAMAAAEELPRATRRTGWRTDLMTDAQAAFIRSLGGSIRGSATKGEASDLIEELLGKKPITNRQQMVMRFWSRERQPEEGPREVSEWMDQFYQEDGDRKLAWELFKNECEDDGLQGDPSRVPIGVGPKYLDRIKAGGEAAIPKFWQSSAPVVRAGGVPSHTAKKSSPWFAVIVVGVVIAAALVVLAGRSEKPPPTRPTGIDKPLPTSAPVTSPLVKKAETAPATSQNENQVFIRRLPISGLISVGGGRARVSIEGKMLGPGDVVDSTHRILVYSINADTRTITFVDMAGEMYSRTLN